MGEREKNLKIKKLLRCNIGAVFNRNVVEDGGQVQSTARRPRCGPCRSAHAALLVGRRAPAVFVDVGHLPHFHLLGRTPVVESEHWAPPNVVRF